MDAWLDWTSLIVGIGGLVASVVGVVYALLARRAAKSAEIAANEARNTISQTLSLVSAQRALSIISRLRVLHQSHSWQASIELYQELRTLLNDVSGMLPRNIGQARTEIDRQIGQLATIQSLVQESATRGGNPADFRFLSESLNSMEATLEALVSTLMPPGEEEGNLNG